MANKVSLFRGRRGDLIKVIWWDGQDACVAIVAWTNGAPMGTLRAFTARLLAEVKAQAILIEKLRHQLARHRAHRFGASSETAEQLQLALENEPLEHHWSE